MATVVMLLVVVGGVAFARADCEWNSASGWNCSCHPGQLCEGTNKPAGEYIWGTTSSDTILAYAGNDVINADPGPLQGGSGDRVDAGPGNDDIYGKLGNDLSLVGGDGDDYIDGGDGNNDRCDGGNGYDEAYNCEFTVRVEGP